MKKTKQGWAVIGNKDFDPEMEVNTFPTRKAAEAFFREVIQDALDDDDTDMDDDGRTLDDCVEECVANVGYMRFLLVPTIVH